MLQRPKYRKQHRIREINSGWKENKESQKQITHIYSSIKMNAWIHKCTNTELKRKHFKGFLSIYPKPLVPSASHYLSVCEQSLEGWAVGRFQMTLNWWTVKTETNLPKVF